VNLELIILIVSASINIVAFSVILYLRKIVISSASLLEQADIDRLLLARRLEQELSTKESTKLEQTEGFVKFLSESRDWAFKYIEEVQAAIVELGVYEKNIVVDKTVTKAVEAYSNLKKFLPNEGTTNKEKK
jgi:predicted RNA-binding protein with PUA domain